MADKAKCLQVLRRYKYPAYVLIVLMLANLLNQLNRFVLVATNASMSSELRFGDRVLEAANTSAMEIYLADPARNASDDDFCDHLHTSADGRTNGSACQWRFLGTGIEYQLLVGPLFIILFSLSGIPLGMIAEMKCVNRKNFLSGLVILWSLMTIICGLSTAYWHVAVTRLALGILDAGCAPFAASILADYFSPVVRGSALGFFNWGLYLGYSLSFVLILADRSIGWRYAYFITGSPGLFLGFLMLFTVREKERRGTKKEVNREAKVENISQWRRCLVTFCDPVLIFLSLGGALRNGAGYIWAYNINNFFSIYHPNTKIEMFMSWIPLTFGTLSSLLGGALSDWQSRTRGPVARLVVLVLSQVLAIPFQVLSLYSEPLVALLMQIPVLLFGEMWIGVSLAVLIDLVPTEIRGTAIGVYLFVINAIGGNMNVLIEPLRRSMSLRMALTFAFPGFSFLSVIMFALTVLFFQVNKAKKDKDRKASRYCLCWKSHRYIRANQVVQVGC